MAGTDVVVHFAAESPRGPLHHRRRPFVCTNVVGTQVLLRRAPRHGVARFVHVCTDEVYGSIDERLVARGRTRSSPTALHGDQGRVGPARAVVLPHVRLPVCITRCCNNYGPYQFPEKVIPLFVTNLMEGKKVPLYGDGLNVRDWLHVEDHCRGIQLVAEKGRAARSTTSAATTS